MALADCFPLTSLSEASDFLATTTSVPSSTGREMIVIGQPLAYTRNGPGGPSLMISTSRLSKAGNENPWPSFPETVEAICQKTMRPGCDVSTWSGTLSKY